MRQMGVDALGDPDRGGEELLHIVRQLHEVGEARRAPRLVRAEVLLVVPHVVVRLALRDPADPRPGAVAPDLADLPEALEAVELAVVEAIDHRQRDVPARVFGGGELTGVPEAAGDLLDPREEAGHERVPRRAVVFDGPGHERREDGVLHHGSHEDRSAHRRCLLAEGEAPAIASFVPGGSGWIGGDLWRRPGVTGRRWGGGRCDGRWYGRCDAQRVLSGSRRRIRGGGDVGWRGAAGDGGGGGWGWGWGWGRAGSGKILKGNA